jgi:aryl-alcohol dehydrogenase-like predicted oxidoreductase
MSSINKLILGTVQFGLNYGINNQDGKVSQDEVNSILVHANASGIDMLDTSYAYGTSELALGMALKENPLQFNIVSKYPRSERSVDAIFKESLIRLGQESLYGYLVHHFDFYKSKPRIWEDFIKLKEDGKVSKIGFSLYSTEELQYLLDHKVSFDLLQIPYNIFDRQFESYLIDLKANGVEIHTRSVFLQGLFFKDINGLNDKMLPLKPYLADLQKYCLNREISIEQLSLNYVLENSNIDKVLIGIDKLEQLQNNINVLGNGIDECDIKFINSLKIKEKELLSPVNWN